MIRVVQQRPVLGDLAANLADHRARVLAAAEDGVDLVLCPEMLALSEDVDVAVGLVERGDEGYLYNSCAYLHRCELLHCHRKTYLPTYGAFDEGRIFSPGREIETFDAPWGRAALVVCEESWHPAVAHGAVMQGADALLVISNSPGRNPLEGDWGSQRGWRANLC